MTRISKFLYILPLLLVFAGCVKGSSEGSLTKQPDANQPGCEASVRSGVADIFFSEEMASKIEAHIVKSSSAVYPPLGEAGIDSLVRIFPDGGPFQARRRAFGLHRWYRAYFAEGIPLTKACDSFSSLEGVECVETERKIKSLGDYPDVFNDPQFTSGKQWHYFNDGSLSSNHSSGADINVVPVWQNYTRGSRSVRVAVIDGGIDSAHEDLAGNCIGGRNFVTGGKVTAEEHGTHVAGTIAAVNNNGTGVCGIAGGDAAKGEEGVGLLSCQIFVGSKSGDGAEALVWAADNGALIANNSWGYDFDSKEDAQKTTISRTLKDAIDYFVKFAGCDENGEQLADSPMKGGLVLFSAGNDGWDVNPIGQYDAVMSVGAMTPDYSRATYSNYGDWVDIAAPGGAQSSRNNTLILSTLPDNKYGYLQGTSMACPHVSGVAALVVSYFGGPGFTADMLWKKLLSGARYDALPLSADIGPLLDAYGAFTTGGVTPPEKVSDYTVDVTGNRITARFAVTSDPDDLKTYGYTMCVSRDEASLGTLDPLNIPSGVLSSSALVGTKAVGEEFELTLGKLEFESAYYVGIIAYDYSRNYSEMSEIKKVTTGRNGAPTIVCTEGISSVVLKSYEDAVVHFRITDPEGESLSVDCGKTPSGCSFSKVSEGEWSLKINGRLLNEGEYSVNIVATDSYGLETSFVFSYTILPNHAPAFVGEFGDIYLEKKGESLSFDLNRYFIDEDGESLKFSASVSGNNSVATATVGKDGVLDISVKNYGLVKISVSALDAKNASAVAEFSIMAKSPDNLVEAYPVPTKDYLTVRTGPDAETLIELFSASGTRLYSKTLSVSAFSPYKLDLKGYAPGKYCLRVTIGGTVYEKTVVKI